MITFHGRVITFCENVITFRVGGLYYILRKDITFRVFITYWVNGITSRGDYYILRRYYIVRHNRHSRRSLQPHAAPTVTGVRRHTLPTVG